MLTELVTVTTSLRTAGHIVKGLMGLQTTAEVQAKAIELNGLILDAQGELLAANVAQSKLVDEVRELNDQIERMQDWETQKQRYKLVMPYPGCFVYALRKSMSNDEPPHYLCTSCYEQNKRSILQNPGDLSVRAYFLCPICALRATTPHRGSVPPKYAEDAATTA